MKIQKFSFGERLCLFALRDIMPGQELAYSYGDEKNLWWRKKKVNFVTF
jgi:SET domain-containing protein